MGWGLLNNQGDGQSTKQSAADASGGTLADKVFYPLTFPVTAGPGCIVVMLTLSAHASKAAVVGNVLAHIGIAVAVVALSFSVFLCYSYAPKITQKIAPQTAQGILRVIAFVLMCIGVQIAANGLEAMIAAARK
jgi:multiple antibiotic resistance protein